MIQCMSLLSETLNVINNVLCARNKDLHSSGPPIKINSSDIIKRTLNEDYNLLECDNV
jgi:hypothetical protein